MAKSPIGSILKTRFSGSERQLGRYIACFVVFSLFLDVVQSGEIVQGGKNGRLNDTPSFIAKFVLPLGKLRNNLRVISENIDILSHHLTSLQTGY